jgi:hypothetical protein
MRHAECSIPNSALIFASVGMDENIEDLDCT